MHLQHLYSVMRMCIISSQIATLLAGLKDVLVNTPLHGSTDLVFLAICNYYCPHD